MNIVIHEISKTDLQKINLARTLFINYFTHLYQNISEAELGIAVPTQKYLDSIFDTTEKEFATNPHLYAALAHIDANIVGFSTFGPLENPQTILVRTLPIDLNYKNAELEIRNRFIQYVRIKFPTAQAIIIMVRKANRIHNTLCKAAGFVLDSIIFEHSPYLKKTYANSCYNGYIYELL